MVGHNFVAHQNRLECPCGMCALRMRERAAGGNAPRWYWNISPMLYIYTHKCAVCEMCTARYTFGLNRERRCTAECLKSMFYRTAIGRGTDGSYRPYAKLRIVVLFMCNRFGIGCTHTHKHTHRECGLRVLITFEHWRVYRCVYCVTFVCEYQCD